MKRIKTVLIDDEGKNLKILEHFLSTYCPQVAVVGQAQTKSDAKDIIDREQPELIFLDILLDEGTGFDVLEEVQHKKAKIIFVTSYAEYAVKAFKYCAVDYLLKPLSIEDLILAVNKAYSDIEREWYTSSDQIEQLTSSINDSSALDFIAVPSMDKIEFLKIKDIIYLKSEGRYTEFYLSTGVKIMSSKNLGEFESIVDKNVFFRIHKSYMVNLSHVANINKVDGSYCEMSNNVSLPIAKRRHDAFSKFLRIK
ncbi:MAG: LytTR family DNA-binding domain-containing protein [Aureisphaera sp.]